MIDQDVLEAVPYLDEADMIELRDELQRISALPAGEGLSHVSCTHPPRGRDAEFHALELAILARVNDEVNSLEAGIQYAHDFAAKYAHTK